MEPKFMICEACGNIIEMVKDVGVPVMCHGENMVELEPGTSDGAAEKHVPVIRQDGCTVTVTIGDVPHPMTEEHYIEWIVLVTKQGCQKKNLSPGTKPEAVFALAAGDEVVSAYEYCNIHGLWKK